jgi:hypothetical protein
MALVRKTAIQTLIDTNLATAKTPKISPTDHRPVAQGIINYIDNRFLTNTQGVIYAGSYNIGTNVGGPDYEPVVSFGTTVDSTDYIVVGCITSVTAHNYNSRFAWMVRDRTTTQFTLLLRAINPVTPTSALTFEYLLVSPNEIE